MASIITRKKRATTLKKNTRKPTHFDFMNTQTVQQAICYAFYNIYKKNCRETTPDNFNFLIHMKADGEKNCPKTAHQPLLPVSSMSHFNQTYFLCLRCDYKFKWVQLTFVTLVSHLAKQNSSGTFLASL